jgi:hypothetical protein
MILIFNLQIFVLVMQPQMSHMVHGPFHSLCDILAVLAVLAMHCFLDEIFCATNNYLGFSTGKVLAGK